MDSLPKPGISPPPPKKRKNRSVCTTWGAQVCDSHKPRNINIWYSDWNQNMLRYMPQLAEGPPLSSNFPKRFVSPSAGHHPNHFQTTSMEQNSVFRSGGWSFTKKQVVTLGQITISMPRFQNFLDTGFNPATTQNPTPKKKNCKITC